MAGGFKSGEDAIIVSGIPELRRALKAAGDGADKRLRADLKQIGEGVLKVAKANAPVGPRPKRSSTRPLRESLRIAVNAKGVSVYSNELHAAVQDVGGRVGNGAIVPRARASHYMTKAVKDSAADTTKALERLLDSLERDFASG